MSSITENIDCMEGMARYPDKWFGLAVVDPPYGIKQDGRNNHTRGKLCKAKDYTGRRQYDSEKPTQEVIDEIRRVSKNQIFWGANHFISLINADSPAWIIWDKMNGETDFADCELAWTSFDCAARKFSFRWQGMLQGDMKNKQVRIHPNEKPYALYRWTFQNYAKPGDKILDTHLGSGSHRIAAHDMGFDFTGFEKDADYFRDEEARFAAHIKKPVLFAPAEMYNFQQTTLSL